MNKQLAVTHTKESLLNAKDIKKEKAQIFHSLSDFVHKKRKVTNIRNFEDKGIQFEVDGKKFTIINPPVLIPDGTTRGVVDKEIGVKTTINNTKLDPKGALKEILNQYYK